MNDHDGGHVRIERRLDRLTADMAEVKTDVAVLKTDVSKLQTDMAEVKTDVAVLKTDVSKLQTDMAQVKVRVEVIPELMAGQVELREMVAKLLARSEADHRS
jgi:septal ring factor EnvC (AmiA/AmiB activator)